MLLRSSLAFALASGSLIASDARPPRFVSDPDIRGSQIVFAYEGDIWTVTTAGGTARRLTSHPGVESRPRLSPDGKWIAFSAQYHGTTQAYVMPAEGGAPKRLTWRGPAQVAGWTPDGRNVVFQASFEVTFRPIPRLYTVPVDGGEPRALPVPRATQGSFSPDGRLLAYNPKGNEEYYWKRYKGGQHPEVWLCDLKAGTHRRLTDYEGKNAHPLFAGDRILFVSDRGEGGISNLYSLDPATKAAKPLTSFKDFDVQWPATDGRSVVFAQGGTLHLLDLASGSEKQLAFQAPTDAWKTAPRVVNPKDWIQGMALGPGGKTAVLEARGEVMLVPVDGSQHALNLTATPGARERFPRMSADGAKVAYLSDEGGDYDLYVRPAAGGPATRYATGLKTALYHLEWSPDGKKILFGDKSFALHVLDLETRKLTQVDAFQELKNDQFTWEVSDYTWSPDSRWVAYSTVLPNRNSQIWLYNLDTKQRTAVTNGFYDSLNPAFDADGSSLYFLSYSHFETRLDPSQDHHIQSAPTQVMAVKLKADDGKGAFRIDLEGLQDRILPLPVKPGNLFHLRAGKGVVAWTEVEGWDDSVNEEVFGPRGQDKWKLSLYEPAANRQSTLSDTISAYAFSPEGEHLILRKQAAFHVGPVAQVASSKALPAKLDLERMSCLVDPKAEWRQIFNDTWRWYRDFFYDAGMHGQDWQALGDKFKAWLPDLTGRGDLNWLLSQMVGELCVSHTYVSGGDFNAGAAAAPSPVFTGLLGADFGTDQGFVKITRAYGPTAYARDLKGPLHLKVKDGEFLLAINGQPLKAGDNLSERLQVIKGQKVSLTVNAKPSLEGARTVEVEPVQSEGSLRYERWVADNIAAVEKASKGQLGYMHITAMGDQNIGQFDKYWRAFRYRKGIVIDVRGNGGGWTEYFMLDQLERKQVGFNVLRGMGPFRYPGTASDGRYVFLSNEANGSDGEAFLSHVKARNLGTIVGKPSWGGLVGIINTQFTLDGGTVEQSNNAFYGREGQWWVENRGVVPDLEVDNDPESLLKGRDPQLDAAIATLLNQLETHPTPAFPPVPAYPKR